jgi:hypothetical protein
MSSERQIELRIWAMDPVRRVWTIRYTCFDIDEACREAAAIRNSGLRVRVLPHERKLLTIKPEVSSETRTWRLRLAGQMSDLADAKKRYKSPG